MRLFKRRRRSEVTGMPNTSTVQLRTELPSYSSHSVPFDHSPQFILDSINPLDDERDLLKRLPVVDHLHHDKRDPEIDADTRVDIDYGKRQFINHTFTTRVIVAQCAGERVVAESMKTLVDEEIAYYTEQETALKTKLNEKETRTNGSF